MDAGFSKKKYVPLKDRQRTFIDGLS